MENGPRDYAGIAEKYARAAVSDRRGRRHCKWVRPTAKRHLADLKKQARKRIAYRFDDWQAGDVCGFIVELPHVEGVWDHDTLILEHWQIFILAVIFGWRRISDGGRRDGFHLWRRV